MNIDYAGITLIICITILIILFAGEPDLMDTITNSFIPG